ncbi:hypothetical protein DY000_02026005 [Brassica cretica]|uniref:Neprosin PEP catalytic domain-containing protein n=1 Tax=Brassica cretica TaxID=69181 RepID=A0ABQ7DYV3_BRACR|nr:hypothetical protein DY000_02026005 [Brassica cretica]
MLLTLTILCFFYNGVHGTASLEIDMKLKALNKPELKTIKSEDGDIIDCVDIYKQPAFDHPALRNHKLQEQYQFGVSREDISRTSSPYSFGRKPPHIYNTLEKAHQHKAYTNSTAGNKHNPRPKNRSDVFRSIRSNYLGAQTNINVWNPSGVQKGDYSSAQMWLLAGDQSEMSEVIEAGWMSLELSLQKDAYRKTGCINLLCSGFVQTSKHLALGAAIEPVSRSGHEQYYITVKIYQDSQSKNWWLASHDNVYGYWPRAIFKHLPQGATAVQWGGEVYSRNVRKKPHTKTPMGSGESPIQLLGKACYHTFIRIKDASMHPKYSMPLAEFSDENQCYTTILHKETNVSEPYLYFGGSLLKKKIKKNFGGSGQSPLCR